MLQDTPGRVGPAASWEALERQIGLPSPRMEDRNRDMLCWYDGPQVSVGRIEGCPSHFLELHYADGTDTRPEGLEYPVWSRVVSHIMEFPTREAIDATLHEDFVPTLESYRSASSIQRIVREWTLHESHVASDMYEMRTAVSLDQIPASELPDEDLRPSPSTTKP